MCLINPPFPLIFQFSELEKIASTKSNAYKLEPLDLSTRYLAETVDFLGLESCTGKSIPELVPGPLFAHVRKHNELVFKIIIIMLSIHSWTIEKITRSLFVSTFIVENI